MGWPSNRRANFDAGHKKDWCTAAAGLVNNVFGAHADFKLGHPEDEGSLSMADGMPMENQWGTVHRLENENTDDMWNHERAEYLTGTEEPDEHGHVSDAMSPEEIARRKALKETY